MCLPLVPLLAIGAAVTGAAGAVFAGMQAAGQARYAAGVADNNAVYAQRAAAQAADLGSKEELAKYQELSRVRGQQTAAMAANGLDLSSGSALDVQTSTAQLGAANIQMVRDQTARQVDAYTIDAANDRAEAAAKRSEASGAMFGGILGGLGTLLGGASKAFGSAGSFGGGGGGGGAGYSTAFNQPGFAKFGPT